MPHFATFSLVMHWLVGNCLGTFHSGLKWDDIRPAEHPYPVVNHDSMCVKVTFLISSLSNSQCNSCKCTVDLLVLG